MSQRSLTVLVTGGAGFLGSAASAALVARGHRVVALDAHAWGRPSASGVTHVTGDVRDADAVDALVAACDRVLHLAAIADVRRYLTDTVDVLDVNLLGTRNALLAAFRHHKPMVIASSSEAFGKNPLPLHEGADTWLGPTTNARWCYAVSKLAGEHYAWGLARKGLSVSAVRYFNAYGPLLDAPGRGRVISTFLGAVQAGAPLRLVDGGGAVRCFCYVDDAVEATVRLLLALPEHGGGGPLVGRPFNVGHPEPVTMRQLAQAVVRLTGHPHGVVDVSGDRHFGPGFEEIPHRVPVVDALRDATGFVASVDLEQGLRQVLAHWGMLRADAPPPPPPAPIPTVRPRYDADSTLLTSYAIALTEGRTTNHGPHVQALEREAPAALGLAQDAPVLAMGSGADALNVAVRAAHLRGAVILPAFTYVSTLNAVELHGLRPVFCDVDPDTWTLCPASVDAALAEHDDVVAVMPVSVFGVPPDLRGLRAVIGDRLMVYDAAQALGTAHDLSPADVATWSLHATKLLPALEGGLLWAKDPILRARCQRVRTHGLDPDPYDHEPGYNAKLDELSAATARHGLRRLPAILADRRAAAARIGDALVEAGWTLQGCPPDVVPNHQNLCALAPAPAPVVIELLAAHGISARRYFHPPMHHLRRHAGRWRLPVTEAVYARLVSVPLHTGMLDADVARVCDAVRALVVEQRG